MARNINGNQQTTIKIFKTILQLVYNALHAMLLILMGKIHTIMYTCNQSL